MRLVAVQMWKYEGRQTLDHYLRRRDCVPALADALGIEQAAVVPTVMQQVLQGIAVRCPSIQRLAAWAANLVLETHLPQYTACLDQVIGDPVYRNISKCCVPTVR